jgi:hypothetical protein
MCTPERFSNGPVSPSIVSTLLCASYTHSLQERSFLDYGLVYREFTSGVLATLDVGVSSTRIFFDPSLHTTMYAAVLDCSSCEVPFIPFSLFNFYITCTRFVGFAFSFFPVFCIPIVLALSIYMFCLVFT